MPTRLPLTQETRQEDLVRAARAAREVSHGAELVHNHQDALLGRAVRLCGNLDRARDLVQDTFERALRRMDTLILGTNPRAWLMTILANLFLDGLRRRRVVVELAMGGANDVDVAAAPAAEELRMSFAEELRISPEELRKAIASLPAD